MPRLRLLPAGGPGYPVPPLDRLSVSCLQAIKLYEAVTARLSELFVQLAVGVARGGSEETRPGVSNFCVVLAVTLTSSNWLVLKRTSLHIIFNLESVGQSICLPCVVNITL